MGWLPTGWWGDVAAVHARRVERESVFFSLPLFENGYIPVISSVAAIPQGHRTKHQDPTKVAGEHRRRPPSARSDPAHR